MDWLNDLLIKPYPSHAGREVDRLLAELLQIGLKDDFLSERPGAGFNMQCRHMRAREIGTRLNEIGGLPLMEYAQRRVRSKAGKKKGRVLSEHLEYAWAEIGEWMR
jgi:hypothetical protein